MFKTSSLAFLVSVACLGIWAADAAAFENGGPNAEPRVIYANQQPAAPAPIRINYSDRPNYGGGFIEFLFNGGSDHGTQRYEQPQPRYEQTPRYRQQLLPPMEPQQAMRPREDSIEPARPAIDPRFQKQVVDYDGNEAPGTIVIDTPRRFLFLVQGGGKAMRYGIGVGRPGFTWAGVKHVSAKKEWPAWTPPPEMLKRRPDLPRHMEGGPDNPLGARAMYLGSSLYRIHGSNEPWTIGTAVSSGCIRMRNEDVIDLYGRVNVGTRVIVI